MHELVPASSLMEQSQGWWGGNFDTFALLKSSAKSAYNPGILTLFGVSGFSMSRMTWERQTMIKAGCAPGYELVSFPRNDGVMSG